MANNELLKERTKAAFTKMAKTLVAMEKKPGGRAKTLAEAKMAQLKIKKQDLVDSRKYVKNATEFYQYCLDRLRKVQDAPDSEFNEADETKQDNE